MHTIVAADDDSRGSEDWISFATIRAKTMSRIIGTVARRRDAAGMNAAHVHLLLNHFPIVGLVFLLPVLIYATVRGYADYYRLALVGLGALALISVPVYLSGEGAEETVEHLPAFSQTTHDILESHEDAALFALIAIIGLGALALCLLILENRAAPLFAKLRLAPLVLILPTLAAFAVTANPGGQIMHTEIRPPGADATHNFLQP